MAKIKKVKLTDGTSYDLTDAGAVRFDSDQSLSDNEKTKVLSNIGALKAPSSGSTGQVLTKTASGTEWATPETGSSSETTLEWEEF